MDEIRNLVRDLVPDIFLRTELGSLISLLSYECNWEIAIREIEIEIETRRLNRDYYRVLLNKINAIDVSNKEKINRISRYLAPHNDELHTIFE